MVINDPKRKNRDGWPMIQTAVPTEHWEWLKDYARKEDRSIGSVVRRAIALLMHSQEAQNNETARS